MGNRKFLMYIIALLSILSVIYKFFVYSVKNEEKENLKNSKIELAKLGAVFRKQEQERLAYCKIKEILPEITDYEFIDLKYFYSPPKADSHVYQYQFSAKSNDSIQIYEYLLYFSSAGFQWVVLDAINSDSLLTLYYDEVIKARNNFGQFKNAVIKNQTKKEYDSFYVDILISTQVGLEEIRIHDIHTLGDNLIGILPEDIDGLKAGDTMIIKPKYISDWSYFSIDENKTYGAYTVDVWKVNIPDE